MRWECRQRIGMAQIGTASALNSRSGLRRRLQWIRITLCGWLCVKRSSQPDVPRWLMVARHPPLLHDNKRAATCCTAQHIEGRPCPKWQSLPREGRCYKPTMVRRSRRGECSVFKCSKRSVQNGSSIQFKTLGKFTEKRNTEKTGTLFCDSLPLSSVCLGKEKRFFCDEVSHDTTCLPVLRLRLFGAGLGSLVAIAAAGACTRAFLNSRGRPEGYPCRTISGGTSWNSLVPHTVCRLSRHRSLRRWKSIF